MRQLGVLAQLLQQLALDVHLSHLDEAVDEGQDPAVCPGVLDDSLCDIFHYSLVIAYLEVDDLLQHGLIEEEPVVNPPPDWQTSVKVLIRVLL